MSMPRLQFGPQNWWDQPPLPGQPTFPQQAPPLTPGAPRIAGQIGPSGPPGSYGVPAYGQPQPTPWWTTPMAGGAGQQPGGMPAGRGGDYMRLASGGGDLDYSRTREGNTLTPKTPAPGPTMADTGGATLGTKQPNLPPTPMAEFTPATAGQARVTVNPDGSWTLPNGVTVPAATRTTVDILGEQVALPIYWNGGTWRGDINGHPEDALGMLVRRLSDAKRRGLNVQDPNVIYDEIARIRDDIMSDGINPNDLERMTGITGLHEFVRGTVDAAGNPVGSATPPGTQPPGTQPPGGGSPPGTNTAIPPGEGGRYGPAATAMAAQDQQAGFDMLWQYLTGSSTFGGGPFDDFLQSFLGPLTTSVLNAQDTIEGGLPNNMEGVLATLKNGIQGGGDLFGYLNGMGQQAVRKMLGSKNLSFADLKDTLQVMSPLQTVGRGPLQRSAFGFNQGNALRAAQERAYADPRGLMGAGWDDWGTYFQQSPFYQQYYR